MSSSIARKATASAVNVGLVMTASTPFYLLLPLPQWKISTVAIFFIYCVVFRVRDVGMMVAGTYGPRASLGYVACYTAGFSTLLWWLVFPFDVALFNGLAVQLPCLLIAGNTAHGLLADYETR